MISPDCAGTGFYPSTAYRSLYPDCRERRHHRGSNDVKSFKRPVRAENPKTGVHTANKLSAFLTVSTGLAATAALAVTAIVMAALSAESKSFHLKLPIIRLVPIER